MLLFCSLSIMKINFLGKFFRELLAKPLEPKTFKGGFFMPSHKQMAKNLAKMPLQKTYKLSLRTNRGFLKPIKKEGNRVMGGEVIAVPEHPLDCLLHSPTSGIIKSITKTADFFGENALSIEIESDFADELQKFEPLNLENSPQELLQRIENCGILGLGGAGFPTAKKLNKTAQIFIINAAECEPYLTCDEVLMQEKAREIILGVEVVSKILNADKVIFAIEDDKNLAIEKITEQIKDKNIQLEIIPAKYPSGNTRQLIELLLNKRISPNLHLQDLGIVIHNVATIFAIYEAVFCGKALIERFITLSGENLKKAQVIKTKIGTKAEDLINYCEGAKDNSSFVVGGPMMGTKIFSLNAGIFKTTAAILALPQMQEFEHLPCIRCSRCAEVCPLNLLPMQFYFFAKANNQERLKQERIFDCVECGLCAAVCPSKIPLTDYIRYAQNAIKKQEEKSIFSAKAQLRHENKLQRLAKEAKKREELAKKQREALNTQALISPVKSYNPTQQIVDNNQERLKAIEEAKKRAAERRAKRMENKDDKN